MNFRTPIKKKNVWCLPVRWNRILQVQAALLKRAWKQDIIKHKQKCREERCNMRHLKICKIFRKTWKPSSLKSAQTCTKEVNPQDKVGKSITKHDKYIITMNDETNSFKLGIQSYEGKQINGDKIAPEILLKYEMCEYSSENEITLKKRMNMKCISVINVVHNSKHQ